MGFLFGAGVTSPNYDAAAGLPGFKAVANLQGKNSTADTMSRQGITKQSSFLDALGMNGGLGGIQSNILNQQQGLANQYQQVASGRGPNPAQTQLAMDTGQNMQQQAALMASARGGQSNPGLVARQAAQAGGGAQQQAVGQAATLGAQQQLAGMQGLAAQQGNMANLATAGIGQQQSALTQLQQSQQNYQNMLLNALAAQNTQQVSAQNANVGLYNTAMQGKQAITGGILNSIGGLLGGGMGGGGGKSQGGVVHAWNGIEVPVGGDDSPGFFSPPAMPNEGSLQSGPVAVQQQTEGPQSIMGKNSEGSNSQPSGPPAMPSSNPGADALAKGVSSIGNAVTGTTARENAMKYGSSMLAFLSAGGPVNGTPQTAGDSPKNDTVPTMLSPGEIVIKRSAAGDPHSAAAFLNSLMGWNLKAH